MELFRVFLIISALLLIIINIYLYKRYIKLAQSYAVNIHKNTVFLILFSGLLIFLFSLFLHRWVYQHSILPLPIRYISAFYLGFLIYSFIFFLAGDILDHIVNLSKNNKIKYFFSKTYAKGLIVPCAAILITLYGFYNAVDYKVTSYEILINKKSAISTLNIVMLSDLHLGTSVREKELAEIIKIVKGLSPDIFFICGDTFDHDSPEKMMRHAADMLGKIKTPYGTYLVMGNHEYYIGNMQKIFSYFTGADIQVLNDKMVRIEDIYLAGRKDMREKNRAILSDIIYGADPKKPIILLDHQPNAIDEAIENGIDLQLSGHTHNGQIFPFNYITDLLNKAHYGLQKEGSFKAIVSSGAGTWKYPIRTGSSSEIVRIKINFLKY